MGSVGPLVILLMISVGPTRAQAAPSTPPAVAFLRTAEDPAGRAREDRFVRELRLVLDEITVQDAGPAPAGFVTLGMGPQVQWLRSQGRTRPALATLWLSQPSADLLLLHLVSVSTGQALARLVEASAREGAEHRLALSARELLGTAYLIGAPRHRQPPALRRVVETLRKRVAAPLLRPERPPPALPPWSLGAASRLQVGVWGMTTGLTLATGAGLDAEVRLGRSWLARARLDVIARPLGEVQTSRVRGLGVDPGLEGGHAWRFGASTLVLVGGCRFAWSALWIRTDAGAEQRQTWSELQLSVALELRWRLASRLSFMADLGMQVTPDRHRIRLLSTRETVVTTPWLTAGFSVGLRWSGR